MGPMVEKYPKWDVLDKAILNLIQWEFPIEERPYKELANRLNSSEEEVFKRVKGLLETGCIRRLGGIFDTRKLGFYTTLVAVKVEESKIDAVAEKINQYSGVTHNYKRSHEWNLWFTLAGEDKALVKSLLEDIESFDGVEALMELPAEKKYKLGLTLPVD